LLSSQSNRHRSRARLRLVDLGGVLGEKDMITKRPQGTLEGEDRDRTKQEFLGSFEALFKIRWGHEGMNYVISAHGHAGAAAVQIYHALILFSNCIS
jgi:hypothetical protein